MKRRTTVGMGILLSLAAFGPVAPGRAVAEQLHSTRATTPNTREGSSVLAGHGAVRTSEGSPWTPIQEGSPIPNRCELRATDDPLRVRLAGGGIVELAPR